MKRQVVWAETALQELKNQVSYIYQHNQEAARKIARLIREAGNNLGASPIGRPGAKFGTYEKVLPKTPFIIVFSLDRPGAVTILHVFHGAQDWQNIMDNDDDFPN